MVKILCSLTKARRLFWQEVQPESIILEAIWAPRLCYMVVSQPQYRPQNARILIMGTPKQVPLILGSVHMLTINLIETFRYLDPLGPP